MDLLLHCVDIGSNYNSNNYTSRLHLYSIIFLSTYLFICTLSMLVVIVMCMHFIWCVVGYLGRICGQTATFVVYST
ncbi:hypothetical protein BDF19DRAFT_430685 [Syncephalis fuscata]|nr:hypothetical protein BDF19DRAFT_430685 [Syncephalis fuscata]